MTLPASIRRWLEIAEGDRFEAEVVEGGVLLKRVTETQHRKAWEAIERIVDTPKWREPPHMIPVEDNPAVAAA